MRGAGCFAESFSMCTDLPEIWIKSVGVPSNNVHSISQPPGGAVKGRCDKCWAKFFPMPVGSRRMCIQNFTIIARCVHDLSQFVSK